MISKLKVLGVAVSLVTATCLVTGCGDDNELLDEAKELVTSISVEAPSVRIESEMDNNFNTKHYLRIQSKDENTIINNIKINRGNCGVLSYERKEGDEILDVLKSYFLANKDKILIHELYDDWNSGILTMRIHTKLFNGENLELHFKEGTKDFYWYWYSSDYISGLVNEYYNYNNDDNSNTLSSFNTLDEFTKKNFYNPLFPIKLAYGKTINLGVGIYNMVNCNADDIIEVELDVNGATHTYNFDNSGGF